tara:strand:+ start:3454 stop:4152 length:699 start_codon:yes stop_codon:yes gene_type:complete
MTIVNLHGILGREYGKHLSFEIENPKHVLHAIDCSKNGFLSRIIELQRNGFVYDIIVNKKRIEVGKQMDEMTYPETIDLVPAIVGCGPLGSIFVAVFEFLASGTLLANIANAVIFAAIAYALTPKPEVEALEIEAAATKGSLVFTNRVNVASQGAPVPVGYGRLKVGSQVVQATIKSYPLYSNPEGSLIQASNADTLVSNRIPNEGGPDPDPDPDWPEPDPDAGYARGFWFE